MSDSNKGLLFEPYKLNDLMRLKNRIVQAPCTRKCSNSELVVSEGAIDYYASRADAGLQVTEATLIRADCQGYPNTPGIYTQEQIEGWRKVTDAVHAKGGLIFCQLWHLGRLSHPHYSGVEPVCPSRVPTEGKVFMRIGKPLNHVWPRELQQQEIPEIIENYAQGAENAIAAGFDGVEIHGANGYLIDQFIRQLTNKRTDSWGGTAEKRGRFALEVVDACIDRIGAQRVGLRTSPAADFSMMEFTPGDEDTHQYLMEELNTRHIAYLHVGIIDDFIEYDYLGGRTTSFMRRHYEGTLIGNGAYDYASSIEDLQRDNVDLVAFGKLFIANADLVDIFKHQQNPVPYHRDVLTTFK